MKSSKSHISSEALVSQTEVLSSNDSCVLGRRNLAPIDSSDDEFSCSHPSSSLFLPTSKVVAPGNSIPSASNVNDETMVMTSTHHHEKHHTNDPSTSVGKFCSPFTSSVIYREEDELNNLHQSHLIKSTFITSSAQKEDETCKPHDKSSINHSTSGNNMIYSAKSTYSTQNEIESTQVSIKPSKSVSSEKNFTFNSPQNVDSMTELKLISPSTEVSCNIANQSTC